MEKLDAIHSEMGIPLNTLRKATEHLDTSLLGFEAAVQSYNAMLESGRYHRVPDTELLPVIQSIVFNFPGPDNQIFVAMRNRRQQFSRAQYPEIFFKGFLKKKL